VYPTIPHMAASLTAAGHNAGVTSASSPLTSPYVELDRRAWAALRARTPLTLTETDLARIQGLGDRVDLAEVEQVYLPLTRLIEMHVTATAQLHRATATFLDGQARLEPDTATPFVIGVAGSVAAGKSTTARLLRELLASWPATPRVELVTTDGFLLPNAELERRNLLHRKGFPESYDQRALLRFVADVKSGLPEVAAPVYSHLRYDIVPGEQVVVRRPDVLIVEGLNVLQPARAHSDGRTGLAVSDFFDFSIYVDARPDVLRRWYVERFLRLRATAFSDPQSYFHRYASLSDTDAASTASAIWREINERNLVENVLPTRPRARLVLSKDSDHAVTRVLLRKL
jgi:type I pantothenate kinase